MPLPCLLCLPVGTNNSYRLQWESTQVHCIWPHVKISNYANMQSTNPAVNFISSTVVKYTFQLPHLTANNCRTFTTAVMPDGFNTTVDGLRKCICLRCTLKRQAIAAAGGLPVMKCRSSTMVCQIIRNRTKQHQLNNTPHTHIVYTYE